MIVLVHRGLAWLMIHNKKVSDLIECSRIKIFENGNFLQENIREALLCRKDLDQALHIKGGTETFDKVDKMCMEQNGKISITKKDRQCMRIKLTIRQLPD